MPNGSVNELLDVYDRERLELPSPVTMWEWGFTKSAETWNGRIASELLPPHPPLMMITPRPTVGPDVHSIPVHSIRSGTTLR